MADFIAQTLIYIVIVQLVASALLLAAILFRYFRKLRSGTLNFGDWDQGDTTNYHHDDFKRGE